MTDSFQPAREKNVQAIVSFFESGVKQKAERLGIELEHTLVKSDGSPVSYSADRGVEWLLEQLKTTYPNATYDAQSDLLGVSREGAAVTIEPAAQVELSAGPFTSLAVANECFCAFEDLLARTLEPADARVSSWGYHPTARAADLELIPKVRYQMMNAYLGAISKFGVCMMRGSTSTQVSIDYTSPQDCLRKLRLAFALVPALSLLCDNSPVFESETRTHELVRTEVWRHCDPDRCGVVPGVMDPAFTLEDYARYILDTPAILVPDGDGGWTATEKTFGELYAENPLQLPDVEHALSMFFTDVRLKTYIEIRPADSMPIPYVIAYAALIKGLFYSDRSLCALDKLFFGVREQDIEDAKTSLMSCGYDGTIYGRAAAEVIDQVIDIARAGLDDDERVWIEPLSELAEKRTTLARQAENGIAR